MDRDFPMNEKINTLSATGAGRQPKHMESVQMIERLNVTANQLQSLVDEVGGQGAPMSEGLGNDRVSISLSEFLNNTPEALTQLNSRLEDQINHLRDLLL